MVYIGRKERERRIQKGTAGKSGDGECEEGKSLKVSKEGVQRFYLNL